MTLIGPISCAFAAVVLSAGIARAELDLPAADSCLEDRVSAGKSPADCIEAAHAACQTIPEETPAVAMVCFREARGSWDAGIAEEMARIRDKAPEKIAAIAGIEVKYDLLASLTQCDRMEELALVASHATAETIQRQKSRCEATASGLAYLRLKLRARGID